VRVIAFVRFFSLVDGQRYKRATVDSTTSTSTILILPGAPFELFNAYITYFYPSVDPATFVETDQLVLHDRLESTVPDFTSTVDQPPINDRRMKSLIAHSLVLTRETFARDIKERLCNFESRDSLCCSSCTRHGDTTHPTSILRTPSDRSTQHPSSSTDPFSVFYLHHLPYTHSSR
jgi:hypothetical protein